METKIYFYALVDSDVDVKTLYSDRYAMVQKGEAKLLGKLSFSGTHLNVAEKIRQKISEFAKKMSSDPEYKEFQIIEALVISFKYTKEEFQDVVSKMAAEAF